jgi:hypothetical protein
MVYRDAIPVVHGTHAAVVTRDMRGALLELRTGTTAASKY